MKYIFSYLLILPDIVLQPMYVICSCLVYAIQLTFKRLSIKKANAFRSHDVEKCFYYIEII